MKRCLLFPPRWSTAHPYLSLPCLTGYLVEKGIEIDQYDLNLEEFKYFISKEFLENCMKRINNQDISYEEKEVYKLIYKFICSNRESFKSTIKDIEEFLDFNKYKNMKIFLEEMYNFISKAFEPYNTDIDNINFKEEVSIESLERIINCEKTNPYIEFANIIINKKKLLEYDFIGISIVVPTQIIPAITLCKELKRRKSNIHICIGGSAFSKIYYKIDKLKYLFNYFDSILMFEGEETLKSLLYNLENNKPLDNINNLIYKYGNDIRFNNIEKGNLDLEKIPIPNFKGLELSEYLSPEIILPYFVSRSCYWGKCAFCDHDFGHDGKYRIKSVEKVISDIKKLKEIYNAKYIYFVDEAIPPGFLNKLCDKIIENNIEVSWFTCIKASCNFTDELCEKMKLAGCKLVFIGIESFSEKVLKDMNKGINREDIEISTKNLENNGIWVHGFLINGYPSEDLSDKMETILGVFNGHIHSVGLSKFVLTKNSKIIVNNLNFKLKNVKENKDFSSILHFEMQGKEKDNSFEQLADIYSERIYNKLYPKHIFLREHLPIFIKHYDLINNKAYLKDIIKDEPVFDSNILLYNEYEDKTIIYNLKSKSAFVCEYKLKKLLEYIDGNKSSFEIKKLILSEYKYNYEEIEEILNTIFE